MAVDGQHAIRASFSRAEEALRSLRESAAPARAIEETAQRLLAAEADQAARVEELRATCETVAAHAEEGLTAAPALSRAEQRIREGTGDMQASAEGAGAGAQEIAASVEGVRKDTEGLAASVDAT